MKPRSIPFRPLFLGLVLAIGFCLAGCSAVYAPGPVGEKPPKDALDPALWEGTWIVEDNLSVAVGVADAKKGDLNVASIEAKSSGGDSKSSFTLNVARAALRQSATDALILSIEDSDHPDQHRWTFCGAIRADSGGQRAILWLPNVDKIKEWIKAKKLPGEPKDSDVMLGKLTPAMVDQITSPSTGLLKWDSPVVLKKLKK